MNSVSNNTPTFTRPPTDMELTLDQIYDWHRIKSSEYTAFVFPKDRDESQTQLTWKEIGEAIIRGKDLAEGLIPELRSREDTLQSGPIIVGILATSDVVTFTTFLLSLIRLSHQSSHGVSILPFLISTRNPSAAVAKLARDIGIRYLWITEGPMRALVDEALNQGFLSDVTILQMPLFSELFPAYSPPPVSASMPNTFDHQVVPLESPALILHSSGSTGFPKPRTLTHGMLLEWSRLFERGHLKVQDETMTVHGMPPFHASGIFTVAWAASSGIIRAVPSPHATLPSATAENVLELIEKTNSTLVFCVPAFLETWSQNSRSTSSLLKLKALFWGGAPMEPEAGRFLHKSGVRIQMLFGATETGITCLVPDKPYSEGYEWFEFSPHVAYELIAEPDEERVFELVFKQCSTHHPAFLNTESEGVPGYVTSDLVERHPIDSKLFRIKGRTDDQIIKSNGEKIHPIPLELIITKNPYVKNAIMFGTGRMSNGVLIEPESYQQVREIGLEKFRNLIWHSIEESNEVAPAHSRIIKEMIIVAPDSKPFTYTAKGNPRRGAVLIDYAPEIDQLYRTIQGSLTVDIQTPLTSKTLEKTSGKWVLAS